MAIETPALAPGAGMAHLRFAFHERPAVTVSALVRVEVGQVAEARVAVGSVGVVPVRAAAAEAMLVGLDANQPDAAQYLSQGDSPRDPVIDSATLAAYTAAASLLLNMDEAVTRQ